MNDFIQCVPFIYRAVNVRSVMCYVLRSFSFNFWYKLIEEKCFDAKCTFESILFWNVHRTRWTRGKMFISWFSTIHVCSSTSTCTIIICRSLEKWMKTVAGLRLQHSEWKSYWKSNQRRRKRIVAYVECSSMPHAEHNGSKTTASATTKKSDKQR